MESILQVSNLSKSFGGVTAVKNIDLNICKGEITGIIGPNGAGKTTLFNLLTGIYSPTEGEISYHLKKQVKTKLLKPKDMAGYGVARTFQNIRLFKDMSVFDNVLIGYHSNMTYGVFPSLFRLPPFFAGEKEAEKEVLSLLKIFNLDSKKDELSRNLSYGDQRKVEIARALAARPEILLLDEPAAGMNPFETAELTQLIRWVRDEFNLSIILIEHDMSLVMKLCDQIFVFDYGNLIAQGNAASIQNNERVIKAYLGGGDIA